MRNLKKFLALVLAMMMVFSLMITVNASDFADDADFNASYTTAANVLTRLGVIKGTPGGSFYPKDTLTRGAFATILYRIYTGDTEEKYVGNYKSYASVFPDVPADAYYAGQVGFAVNNMLLKGYPNGNFGPEDYVTGVEAVTGLLRALGYDKDGNEFTGANWDTKALVKATEAGFINRVGKVSSVILNNTPATRELLAELAFDALQADVVYWQQGNQDGGYVGDHQTKKGLTLGGMHFGMVEADNSTSGNLEDIDKLVPADPYGRPIPTHAYVFTGIADPIVVPLDGLENVYESAGKPVNGTALSSAMGNIASAVTTYVDGKDLTNGATPGDLAAMGGYGTQVEVWRSGTANAYTYTAVVIHTFAATLTENDIIPAEGASPRYISLDASNGDALSFVTKDFAAGDTVIFTVGAKAKNDGSGKYDASYGGIDGGEADGSSAGEIVSVKKADSVTGIVSRTSELANAAKSYLYLNGVKYQTSAAISNLAPDAENCLVGTSVTLYLDAYGSVVKYVGPTAAPNTNYVYIEKFEINAGEGAGNVLLTNSKAQAAARVIDPATGNYSVFNLAVTVKDNKYYLADINGNADVSAGEVTTGMVNSFKGRFATWKQNDDGEYVLSLVDTTTGNAAVALEATNASLKAFEIVKNNRGEIKFDATSDKLYATKNTVLEYVIYRETNGGQKLTVSRTVYNGFSTFPEVSGGEVTPDGIMYVKNAKDPTLLDRIIFVTSNVAASQNYDWAVFTGTHEYVTADKYIGYTFFVNGKEVEYVAQGDIPTLVTPGDVFLLTFAGGYLTDATTASLAGPGVEATDSTVSKLVDGDYIIVDNGGGDVVWYLASNVSVYNATTNKSLTLSKAKKVTLYAADGSQAPSEKNPVVLIVLKG